MPATSSVAERPQLRPVLPSLVDQGGRRYLCLRDPYDAGLPALLLDEGVLSILHLLDGQRSAAELSALSQPAGEGLSVAQVRRYLEQLDAGGFLEGERAQARLRARRAQYDSQAVRPAVHAGGAYPGGAAALRTFLTAGYLHGDGPGALPNRRSTGAGPLAGVIAPHVDLHRGAPTYSWAYRALAESQPSDLYVVLGTCHTPVAGSFAATRKPYDTPLGVVPTDERFLSNLADRWQRDLFEGELSHESEHAVEFQAVYLRSLGLAGEGTAPMVAILCDSLHSLVVPGFSPLDVAVVADFVSALDAALAADGRAITVIAAVDLAHIGPLFGDPASVEAARLAEVRAADLETLELALAGDSDGYYRQILQDGDARRICGLTPIYLLSELMARRGLRGRLLRYTQWADPDGSSSVTFASGVYP